MRWMRSSLLVLILIGGLLAGCAKPSAAPPAPNSSTPAPDLSSQVTPNPGLSDQVVPNPGPLPAGPCEPGASAAILPSAPYGSGVPLKPPTPPGTPERPWFGVLNADQTDEPTAFGSGERLGTVSMRKGGTATVDTAGFTLEGVVIPAPDPAWFDTHLVLESIQPLNRQISGWSFSLRIPAGKPGDAFRLTLKDVLLDNGSSGDIVVTFCRQAPPRATATVKTRVGWRPVDSSTPSGSVVPADAQLALRIAFTHDMLTETVERSLTGPHDKGGQSQGEWITGLKWLDKRTLEVTADRPQPSMRLNVSGAQDTNGLFVAGGLPNLYSGEPPRVLAIDPASGQESRLLDLSPEPNGVALSPDGRLVRVTSWQMRGGRTVPDAQTQLFNLATGEAKPLKPGDLGWAPPVGVLSILRAGENAVTLVRQTAAGRQDTTIDNLRPVDGYLGSPDGKWLAILERTGVQSPYPYTNVQFLIVAADDPMNRKLLTGDANMAHPGKDGIILYDPVWSPDSSRIAFTQPKGDGASLVLADIAAGELRTLAADLPGVRDRVDPVTWSPDGSKILVGPLLVDAATGQVIQRIDGAAGEPFWSSEGRWLLFGRDDFAAVTAYDLKASRSMSLGEGMALGWSPDGTAILIRWPNAQYRLRWGL